MIRMPFWVERTVPMAVWLGIAGFVAGCSPSTSTPDPASVGGHSSSAVGPSPVRRMSPGKPHAPVRIEFDRAQKFAPGEPAEITVTLVPQAALTGLEATFRASEGLELRSGERMARVDAAGAGTPVVHRMTVFAQVAGRYHVTVVVTATVNGAPTARVISMPIAVGDSVSPEKVHASSVSGMDASGQRIHSLPAQSRPRAVR